MAVRVRVTSQSTVSSTSAEERDLGYPKFEVVTDSINEGGSYKLTLAGAATNVQINLGSVASAKLVQVITNAKNPNETPGTIQLKKDSTSGEVTEIVPLTDTKKGIYTVTTSGITALFVSNPGSVVMELTLTIAGD